MANVLTDVVFGAITGGVNVSTLFCLNIVLFLCVSSLAFWLYVSFQSYPFLVPHVGFLLFMAFALWGLINWFVLNAGFVRAEDQQHELGLGKPPQEQTEEKPSDKKDE